MKKLILIFMLLALIPLVSALNECQSIEGADIGCEVMTPVIECSTYDTYTPAHVLDTNDGSMTQIGSTGIYYFTFNESTAGAWTIHLCSNHTSQITIGITDQANMNSINTTLYNKINAINSSIMDEMAIYSSNATFIGDSVWIYSKDKNVTHLLAPVDVNETEIAQEMFNSNLTALGYTDNRDSGLFGNILIAMDTAMYWIERLLN